jgi:NTE family protein
MTRRTLRQIAAAILLLLPAATRPVAAQTAPAVSERPQRPKIGLALGGGGARGAAHVGVLKVLEELRIPIDYIAGTSMGSVIGGLYVVGYSPESLDKIIGQVDWGNLFVDSAPRKDTLFRQKENDYLVPPGVTLGIRHGVTLPAGLIAGRKLGFLLNTLTLPVAAIDNFNELSIPFRAVATDARTGEVVVLAHGSLPGAIRASMAIPVVFTPVEFEGRSLIDGGTSQNLPVQTVRAMGAEVVIAVDVASSSEIPKEGPRSVADMLGRLIDLPLLRNTLESRPLADLVITPDLHGLSSGDFAKAKEIIPKGEAAARAVVERLSRWSVSEEEYRAWQKSHRIALPEERPILDAVVVDAIPGFDTRRISRVIATRAGLPFNETVLQDDMRRIAGMGIWSNVEFRLEKAEGKNVLHIIVTPKSWGPTYLNAGIDFEINANRADADFDLSLLLDATESNRLGADWKTGLRLGTDIAVGSQFFQPLDYAGRFFVAPRLSWDQRANGVFVNEVEVAQYKVQQGKVGLDLGVELGHLLSLGEFSVGIERGYEKGRRKVGIPQFPDVDVDTGAFVADLRLDQLDNFWFPLNGYFMDLSYKGSRTGLGADNSYNKAQLLALGVETFGRWTGTARVAYGDGFNSAIPFYDLFSLGGFRRLSGRPLNQLTGQTFGFGSLSLRYRLTEAPGAILKGVYVGVTAELGNTWDSRSQASIHNLHGAGSVFLATDTLLGPLYIAYGSSGNKNHAFYLFLNRGF